jgi:hypothetical protein
VKWTEKDPYYWESDSGYRVCKIIASGVISFEAWTPYHVYKAREKIGQGFKLKHVQGLCEAHYVKHHVEKIKQEIDAK